MPPRRPLYQRLLYPLAGVFFCILGIIGILLPFVPGFPALLLGLFLCSCVHAPLEAWTRGKLHALRQRMRRSKDTAGVADQNPKESARE